MSESPVRRVVTGHDARGKAIVVSDGAPPSVLTTPHRPGYWQRQVWVTRETPAPIDGEIDPTVGFATLLPPKNGSVIRVIEFPPDKTFIDKVDAAAAHATFAAMGAAEVSTHGEKPRHPLMHRTKTVDYGIVLAGEITMVLDEEEVPLKAGDIVIQRGTNHAWSNRSDKPCRMVFILIDGKD
jgi:mannose-6-phosphate isomerase-like protein (cupin superfamily)